MRSEKIKNQAEYSRAILDAQSSIVYVRSEKRVVDANRAFYDFFDFVPDEKLLSLGICSYFERDNEEGFLYGLEGTNWFKEIANHHCVKKVKISKNSKKYIFSLAVKKIESFEDIDEELYIITLTDITELESVRYEKMKNLTLASIGKLAAGITHEINTPLTYAKGNLEILRLDLEDIEGYKQRQMVEEPIKALEEALNRISKIVESMREIAGKGTEKKERVDVVRTLILALRMIHSRSKHISPVFLNDLFFSADLALRLEPIYISADRQRIEQVWIIIVNNALDEFVRGNKAYDGRSIKINATTEGHECIVRILDNAGGIAEEIKERLFEPFSSSKTSSGMGIGLNIAHQIILEHDGEISARNEAEGALFEIRFPLFLNQ